MVQRSNMEKKGKESFFLKYFEFDPAEANLSFRERWRLNVERRRKNGDSTLGAMV